jgi:hypothetical protein
MSIGSSQPFRPAGTVAINATTTATSNRLNGEGETILVTNAATDVAFVSFGADASVTAATTGDLPVLPGTCILIGVNTLIKYAAAVLAGGSGQVYFTVGDGSSI